jgi:hypothetical protein
MLLTESLDCQEEENQVAGRILRHNSLKNKPNTTVQIIRFISRFPTTEPTAEDRRAMEKDFCVEARITDPRDIPFDLVDAMKVNIAEIEEDGGCADQKRQRRNLKKHAILAPVMLCLKVSSIGKVDSALRREFAETCKLQWPDAEYRQEQKEQQEKKEAEAEKQRQQVIADERRRKRKLEEAKAAASEKKDLVETNKSSSHKKAKTESSTHITSSKTKLKQSGSKKTSEKVAASKSSSSSTTTQMKSSGKTKPRSSGKRSK